MKKFFVGAALAAFCASPALAHNYQRAGGMALSGMAHQLRGVRAQAIAPAESVYFNGLVVGADPDANVRLSFQRDPEPWNR